MKYILTPDAEKLSRDEATRRGCGRNPADVTRYWYPVEVAGADKLLTVEDDAPIAAEKKLTLLAVKPAAFIAKDSAEQITIK